MTTLTPEQNAALLSALNVLSNLPDGVEIRTYITAGVDGGTDVPGVDFMVALRVERGVMAPPIVTPPPPPAPTYELLYVTSTTGLKVRQSPSVNALKIDWLAYGAQAMVTGSTMVTEKDASGATVTYHWGQLQAGGHVAREFLSKIQPPQ